jgi:hypothetical protein
MKFYLVIENAAEELGWLSPADRWHLFLLPLTKALLAEKIGKVLYVDELIQDDNGQKIMVGNEIAMRVTDLEKATVLIRQIEQKAAEQVKMPSSVDVAKSV